jgi:hypothetical protein
MGRAFNFPKFRAGEALLPQLTAERLNAIIDALDRNRVEFGDNVTGQRTPGGTIVRSHADGASGGDVPDISFILSDATLTVGGVVTRKVLVRDGKINGEFPSGMGTGDEYKLTLTTPEDSIIYAAISFSAETLEISSRTLGVSTAADFPPSTLDETDGFFATQLGFTYIDEDGAFFVLNTHVGDLNFELISGALNGVPAIIPVAKYANWIPFPV